MEMLLEIMVLRRKEKVEFEIWVSVRFPGFLSESQDFKPHL